MKLKDWSKSSLFLLAQLSYLQLLVINKAAQTASTRA